MGRLENIRIVDPVLTELARGYSNAEFIAEKLFPIVPVRKEAGKVPQFGKGRFKIHKTERAIHGDTNVILPDAISTVDFSLTEHDASYPIDYREADESAFDLESYGTRYASDVIAIRREKIAADLAQDASQYASGNKVALSGTSCWSDYTNSDPIATVRTGKEAIRAAAGRYPNVLVLGAISFKLLQDHPKILERIKYSMKGIVTADLLAEILDVPNIAVGLGYSVSDADVNADLWGDNAVLAYVPEMPKEGERTPYEPSYGYTFRKRSWPQVDKYTGAGGKLTYVRSTDLFQVKIVGSVAGYLISNTQA